MIQISFSKRNIQTLFSTVNKELNNINEWFQANKLSLNVKKTKYSLFHKSSKQDDIPLVLPKLKISNYEIERVQSIRFLGVILDQHLSWKVHIKHIENKIAKNIGILYKAKPYLDKRSLLALYFSYIHTYLNYANVAWGSTNRTNLKKLNSQQEHAIRMVMNKDKHHHTMEIFKELKILNIYKLNILNVAIFMHKIHTNASPFAFSNSFETISHCYPTRFSVLGYKKPKLASKKAKYRISFRGPTIWNEFLTETEKIINSFPLFKRNVKSKLLLYENEIKYF